MVVQNEIECASNPHGAASRIIGLCACDRSAGILIDFIDTSHVQRLAAIWLDLRYEIAIGVINKLRYLSTDRDRRELVLGVEDLGIGQAAFRACGHVPVGIVDITATCAERGHGVLVSCTAVGIGDPALAGDVANGIVVVVQAVGSTDYIQPI